MSISSLRCLQCSLSLRLVGCKLSFFNVCWRCPSNQHLFYDEVTIENDEDAFLEDLPDARHRALLDVVDDVLLKLSKLICLMLRNVYS